MNFLLIEVQGRHLTFRSGSLEGRHFGRGEMVSITGDEVSVGCPDPMSSWVLHSTFHRGYPAISCSFFNKRTRMIEERYCKIFTSDGLYMCGPRFPRTLRRARKPHREWRHAA